MVLRIQDLLGEIVLSLKRGILSSNMGYKDRIQETHSVRLSLNPQGNLASHTGNFVETGESEGKDKTPANCPLAVVCNLERKETCRRRLRG